MIKEAKLEDAFILAKLAIEMWHSHTVEELTREFESVINFPEGVCFLKYEQGAPIGFAQCQLRHDYVEGTESSPVGYLEGIFVKEAYRNKGYAKDLLEACQDWARKCHCSEFASDCELDNETSLRFHLRVGFTEANRIICFTKKL